MVGSREVGLKRGVGRDGGKEEGMEKKEGRTN